MPPDSQPTLPEKIEHLHRAFAEAGIPHAFGGALALAYYAEPRATNDIDVNLFIPPDQQETAASALETVGLQLSDAHRKRLLDDAQCRVGWGITPIDLFFASHAFHDAMRGAIREVPFGRGTIPILSAEHLLVCKALYNRPKDWLDIAEMVRHRPPPDRAEAERWMAAMVGPGDSRSTRLSATWRQVRE